MKKINYSTQKLLILVSIFVTTILVSNLASTKLFGIGPLTIDGGTILFPLAYILGDIITEVYGFKAAKRAIIIGFFMSLMMSLTLFVVQLLPPADGWTGQGAYEQILGMLPRIVFASLTAYLIGEFANSYILAKLKVLTNGKMLWTRTLGSTVVAAFIDTTIFSLIAFYGIIPNEELFKLIVTVYLIKLSVEIVITPLTYAVVNKLKKSEGIDHYDTGISLREIV